MRSSHSKYSRRHVARLCATLALPALLAAPALALQGFGFRGFEIYEISDGVAELAAGDVDGDGLADLAVVDNRRSRIEVFRRLPLDAADRFAEESLGEPNAVRYDGRFERRRHPLERRVQQLALGDWNGDGLDDVAWVEDGGRLAVVWGAVEGAEARTERREVDALREGCTALESADVDGDGRPELLAAGKEALIAFAPDADGLGDERTLDALVSAVQDVFLTDLDGDGAADLVCAAYNADPPFRFRLREPTGALGTRVDVDLPQIKSAAVTDLDGDGRSEVLAVLRSSGRLSAFRLTALDQGLRALARQPLAARAGRAAGERAFAVGDLDGDGTGDVVVSEPDVAEVSVLFGVPGARRFAPRSFPSLVGVAHPRLGDVNGDGRNELVVVSSSERMLGSSTPAADGTLDFPRTEPLDGEPLALDLADVDGDGLADAFVIVQRGEGRKREHELSLWRGTRDGLVRSDETYALTLEKPAAALRMTDLDRDGLLDAIVFAAGDTTAPTLLFQRAGAFVADQRGVDAPGLGILVGAGPSRVSTCDVDGDGRDELLCAAKNFARALVFRADEGGRATPDVALQIAGPAPDSRIVGALATDLDGDGAAEIVLVDARTNELLVMQRGADGRNELLERIDAERIDFAGLAQADVDGDGRRDLIVLGRNEVGVLFGGGREATLTEFASYDAPKERSTLDALRAGDLDGDGDPDVVVADVAEHALVLLEADGDALEHGLGFEVFEPKPSHAMTQQREPREILCTDVDGDAKTDIALLVHDKLIVYFQE